MTQEKKAWVKRNLISLSNLVILLLLFGKQVAWQKGVDMELKSLNEHKFSETVHMPLEEKLKIFVTRNEYSGMEKMLEEIDSKVDLLLEKAISGN